LTSPQRPAPDSRTPDAPSGGPRLSRETRLLAVTITVSVLVLLLLARLRFPEPPPIATTTAPPLERLAARATYDELAGIVARLEATISPSLIVLRLAPRVDSTPRQLGDLLGPPNPARGLVQHVPAMRISPTTAVAAIDADTRIAGIVGETDRNATAGIIASDPVRGLALVRVPEAPARVLPQLPLASLRPPLYVVAVEGTHAGITLRPVFLGRGDRFGAARWTRPLLAVGGVPVTTAGALTFTLEGQFVGSVVMEDGALAIAGSVDINDTIERLASGNSTQPSDAGISVQPLTPALAAATGSPTGVVVAEVREDGPADGVLEPGDVITSFGGETIDSAERLLLQLARQPSGTSVALTIVRGRQTREASLTLAPAPAPTAVRSEPLGMRYQRGVGSVVTDVPAGTSVAAAGLVEGDVIVRAGSVQAPSPAQVLKALASLAAGEYLLLTIRRDERQRLVAVQAGGSHASS
jgi:S1-C subfamily serine protease